jgi:antitoxin (DNA-binding transcriptional repressor) of toxin-antitoxin stability system
VHMARSVSIRELRNSTSAVVSELEAGERLTLTVNRRPVADILPHGLLDDLADVRGAELDD